MLFQVQVTKRWLRQVIVALALMSALTSMPPKSPSMISRVPPLYGLLMTWTERSYYLMTTTCFLVTPVASSLLTDNPRVSQPLIAMRSEITKSGFVKGVCKPVGLITLPLRSPDRRS
jgi:hypothetical protein